MKQQKYNSNYPTEHGMTKGISTTSKKMLPAIFFSGVNEVFDIFVCYINSHLRLLYQSENILPSYLHTDLNWWEKKQTTMVT